MNFVDTGSEDLDDLVDKLVGKCRRPSLQSSSVSPPSPWRRTSAAISGCISFIRSPWRSTSLEGPGRIPPQA